MRQFWRMLFLTLALTALLAGCAGGAEQEGEVSLEVPALSGEAQPEEPDADAPQEGPDTEAAGQEDAQPEQEEPAAQPEEPGAEAAASQEEAAPEKEETSPEAQEEPESEERYIRIQNGSRTVVFSLNDSAAALSLYEQLPLTVSVEDFGSSEKIFYPPQELDVSDAPQAQGPVGTLAYYEPWGDVAIFLTPCEPTAGLYGLGSIVSGEEWIGELSGEITIEREEA